MEQPNEATAQAEVDRPAVRYDTIVALQGQGCDDTNGSLLKLGSVQLRIQEIIIHMLLFLLYSLTDVCTFDDEADSSSNYPSNINSMPSVSYEPWGE